MATPTQARVCEYFNYDPETGLLTFKERPRSEFSAARYSSHLKRIGSPAGAVNSGGYQKVLVDGTYHSAHRIIWLMVTGDWVKYPEFEIDHINGDPSDNRISNLRKVTKSENQRNAGKRITNTSGIHGVNWKARGDDDGRWVARIWNGPKHVYLGQFKTLHEARIARKAAERVLGFTGSDRDGYAVRKVEAIRGAA
ncbi:HNH endonuclease [Agrobacterium rhizogenes]|uniref:HNH endonuclease n=1 Tax=Rhizobium rhizogenes TaxID=359 RepID=UPI0015733645|nr:HNH endonuclease [Rhizobium rhizogenes]NTG86184.1 HNH endonuclease [Rhizobium rhizogenes]